MICLSVNDAFVMEAWGRDQGVRKVRMLPDGNGDFTTGVGQLVSKRDLGFGERSWRYSTLVRDGVIEKSFVEPDVPGDPYEVSDADTMLAYLNADLVVQADLPNVSVFTRSGCGHCTEAKRLLDEKGIRYEEIVLADGLTSPRGAFVRSPERRRSRRRSWMANALAAPKNLRPTSPRGEAVS